MHVSECFKNLQSCAEEPSFYYLMLPCWEIFTTQKYSVFFLFNFMNTRLCYSIAGGHKRYNARNSRSTNTYLKHKLTETICIQWLEFFAFIFVEDTQKSINQTFNKNTKCLVKKGLSTSKDLRHRNKFKIHKVYIRRRTRKYSGKY